jgi:hypothetical protein
VDLEMTFLEFIGIGEKADEGKRRMGEYFFLKSLAKSSAK